MTVREEPVLEPTYSRRAVPAGTVRHWCWLFAPAAARAPLLGVFALLAEWRALVNPRTDPAVAGAKLLWWREEMARLARREPVHPIGRFLVALPRADAVDFAPLGAAVEAAAAQAAGVPLEHGADLPEFARRLLGDPLQIAAALSAEFGDAAAVAGCTAALGAADYLARALADYGPEARAGRMVFAVDDLLSAGIENGDLEARDPPPRLREFLQVQRLRAARLYESASALPASDQAAQRGLLVMAALGRERLRNGRQPRADAVRLADLGLAWRTARRAARGAVRAPMQS
jgi:phytoene synthase